MNFLAPAAFALSLLLPVVVAMYLLKLRRMEREVPSVYLWRRMVRDVEANAPWQKLRRNLLLLLQLLFLIMLMLALARPFTWAEGAGGQSVILILDSSASMSGIDVAPSRLEAAKDQARSLVDEMPEGTRVTVMSAGSKAQVMISSTQDRRQAHMAIERIQPGTDSSDLGVALELASALAARQPDTEIIVLSDGRVQLPERLALKGHLRYLPIGLSGDNQAISQLSLEPAPGGSSLVAFAQVVNYSGEQVQDRLSLYADGQLVNAYDLDLPARGQQSIIVQDLPVETEAIQAELARSDVLPTDNHAVAVPVQRGSVAINLVTRGNLFLETALKLLPDMESQVIDPEQTTEFPEADLTILDNYVPVTTTLPAGNLLFIAPPRTTEYFTTTGKIEEPLLRVVDAQDLLVQNVSLSDISVQDAVEMPLPDWARVVVMGEADGSSTPILFAGNVDGRRVAVLAFDLRHSDLPLQVAFPLLWANLVNWLAPGIGGGIPAQVLPGEPLSFPAPEAGGQATITRPDGKSVRLDPQEGRMSFVDTDPLGVYKVSWGKEADDTYGEASFAVNLFSPEESDLKPADALPGLSLSQGEGGDDLQQSRREWWRPFAMLSLALLTGEWFVYQRSALARLRGEARQAWQRLKARSA